MERPSECLNQVKLFRLPDSFPPITADQDHSREHHLLFPPNLKIPPFISVSWMCDCMNVCQPESLWVCIRGVMVTSRHWWRGRAGVVCGGRDARLGVGEVVGAAEGGVWRLPRALNSAGASSTVYTLHTPVTACSISVCRRKESVNKNMSLAVVLIRAEEQTHYLFYLRYLLC